jgi:hypothetical protein
MLNFLEKPALLISNLKPNGEGIIDLVNFDRKSYSTLLVIASNLTATASDVFPL